MGIGLVCSGWTLDEWALGLGGLVGNGLALGGWAVDWFAVGNGRESNRWALDGRGVDGWTLGG